jgi:hypothetical protein
MVIPDDVCWRPRSVADSEFYLPPLAVGGSVYVQVSGSTVLDTTAAFNCRQGVFVSGLNGIAQGFAADCVVDALRRQGVRHALVNTGESELVKSTEDSITGEGGLGWLAGGVGQSSGCPGARRR